MRLISLALACSLIASQSAALSCIRPDMARTFGWASDAEESYVVLLGQFEHGAQDRRLSEALQPASVQVQSRFSGSYLTLDGFVDGPAINVTLDMACLGPWCGWLESDETVIAFVQKTGAGYSLGIDPCFSTTFQPTDGNVAQVEACMRGEACEPAEF